MGALFARIGSWLSGLVGIEVFKTTNKFVFLGILVSMYLALYVTFMAAVAGVVTFSPVQPLGNVAAGLALLPGNINQCMGAIFSAHVIAHVFVMKSKIIKMSAKGA